MAMNFRIYKSIVLLISFILFSCDKTETEPTYDGMVELIDLTDKPQEFKLINPRRNPLGASSQLSFRIEEGNIEEIIFFDYTDQRLYPNWGLRERSIAKGTWKKGNNNLICCFDAYTPDDLYIRFYTKSGKVSNLKIYWYLK